MDDKQFEEKMALLKKSYDRLPSNFDANEVLNQLDTPQQKNIKCKKAPIKKYQRPIAWAAALVSIALIFLLVQQYQQNPLQYSAAEIDELSSEELDTTFTKMLDLFITHTIQKQNEMLETLAIDKAYASPIINYNEEETLEADIIMFADVDDDNKRRLIQQFSEIIKENAPMLIPKDYLANILEGVDVKDNFWQYFTQVKGIVDAYNAQLESELATLSEKGKKDITKVYAPVINAAKVQGITLIETTNGYRFVADELYRNEKYHAVLFDAYRTKVVELMGVGEKELLYSREDNTEMMSEYTKGLLQNEPDEDALVKLIYIEGWFNSLKDSTQAEQQALLAKHGDLPIRDVAELLLAGDITNEQLHGVIVANFKQYFSQSYPDYENVRYIDEIDYEINEDMKQAIVTIYESYQQDESLLQELSLENSALLYSYAVTHNDSELQGKLTADETPLAIFDIDTIVGIHVPNNTSIKLYTEDAVQAISFVQNAQGIWQVSKIIDVSKF